MKRNALLAMGICGLAMMSCQKEIESEGTVRYSNFYVRSPKDSSKWITIEEYNRLYPPSKINDSRSWEDCYYEYGNDILVGQNCSNTRHSGCDEPQGCHKKPK
jgi:hypothetical protein